MSENELYTTDIIKAQLQNLIVCHNYRVYYSLHYSNKNYTAYLDKNTLDFTANNSIQNIFVVLTKDVRISNVLLEIKAVDLTNGSTLIHSSFINCDDFNQCEPAYPPPTPSATVTPTITKTVTPTKSLTPSTTPTNTVTPSVTPTNTVTPSITPTNTVTSSITPTNTVTPSVTPTNSITPTETPTNTPTNSITPTNSVTPSITPTNTPTPTPTASPFSAGAYAITDVNAIGSRMMTIKFNPGQFSFSYNFFGSFDSGNTWSIRPAFISGNDYGIDIPDGELFLSDDGISFVVIVKEPFLVSSKIFFSDDFASTVSQKASFLTNWKSICGNSDLSKLVAVSSGAQIYTSSNSGGTWTARENNRNWVSVAGDSTLTNIIAAVSNGFIYISNNSGETWSLRENTRSWTKVASNSTGNILAAAALSDYIYISTDGGDVWTARENIRNWSSIAINGNGGLIAATVGGLSVGPIYISTNSGVNWTTKGPTKNWKNISVSANGTTMIAHTSNVSFPYTSEVYVSNDSGNTWNRKF